MHCYGYPLDNTPHLDSLIHKGEVTLFSKAISPSTNTIESLTKVLTFQQVESREPWYKYPNLTNVLSRSGYSTYWVSNQEVVGAYMQPINTIANFTGAVTYVQARTQDADTGQTCKTGYDEEVLEHLHTLGDGSSGKSIAQFIHLIGTHMDYDKRFPREYARFSAKDVMALGAKGDKKVIANYINSIYYNDKVVADIIKFYSGEPSIIFYFSDHGESLYDDPTRPNFFGHSITHRSNVEIPFMVYISPLLREQAPKLLARIKRAQAKPFVNDLFTNSLLELLGITTKYSNPQLEIFSDSYNTQRPLRATSMGHLFDPYKQG